MMNFHTPIPRRLAALALLLAALPALGQNIIYEMPDFYSEKPTIRSYKPNVDIKYEVCTTGCPRSFDYIDRTNHTVYSFPFPQAYQYFVHDFDIYNGVVYFCGYKGVLGSMSPIFGWFDIDSAFFNNGNVHIEEVTIYPSVTYPYAGNLDIFAFSKVEVMRVNGYIHLAMVGHGKFGNKSTYVIADARRQSASWTWNLDYAMDVTGSLVFEDVTITKNYVVLLASDPYYEQCVLHFGKPTASAASQCFLGAVSPTPLTTPMSVTDQGLFTVTPHFMKMGNLGELSDGFFTVATTPHNTSSNRHVLSIYRTPVSNPDRRFIFSSMHDTYIEELTAVHKLATICIVTGEEEGLLYKTSYPYDSIYLVQTPGDFRWRSIDRRMDSKGFIVSGTNHQFMMGKLLKYNALPDERCVWHHPLDADHMSREHEEHTYDLYTYTTAITPQLCPVKPEEYDLNAICK